MWILRTDLYTTWFIENEVTPPAPRVISWTPHVWDVYKKVLFHLKKQKLIFEMSITLHPFWVISIPHTSPLSFSGSLTQETFGSNGHFSSGYHLKVPAERQWAQEWLSRDSLQPGSHREDSDWAGVSLTEQGWSTVWAALNNIIFRKG